MATFKHISSKNAGYRAAEQYLTFEHDEFTMKDTTATDIMMKVLEAESAAGHKPPFTA